ncbi:hypothetical protein CEXT_205371 [Caerostris extrusa]|uniref:Uncharacterized protein n=1 Tax=Caerostris extrusa TaxID=172846 RepID=A0AAV4UZH5_CAEEX|nr:hypothetical protein CEXT_205371 [Caerostris extrusa]
MREKRKTSSMLSPELGHFLREQKPGVEDPGEIDVADSQKSESSLLVVDRINKAVPKGKGDLSCNRVVSNPNELMC